MLHTFNTKLLPKLLSALKSLEHDANFHTKVIQKFAHVFIRQKKLYIMICIAVIRTIANLNINFKGEINLEVKKTISNKSFCVAQNIYITVFSVFPFYIFKDCLPLVNDRRMALWTWNQHQNLWSLKFGNILTLSCCRGKKDLYCKSQILQ